MWTLLITVLAIVAVASTEDTFPPQAFPPQAPRMLKRARKRTDRTRIATLNCRTLLADETLDDLDVTLTKNQIDLCALQETRRDGFMSTSTENFIIFWYGECSGHRGVGVAIHKKYAHLVSNTRGIPESNGRLMTMDILLHDTEQPVKLVCAYSPPNTASTRVREQFYSQLRTVVTPNTWLLGDFNARVGRRTNVADSNFGAESSNTVGPFSLKNDITANANGSLLLDIASESCLRHVTSHFSCTDSKRWTWRHPRYHTRTVLDHIFVPAPQMRFVSRFFVAHHITVYTDHRLVAFEVSFRPRLAKNISSRSPPIDKCMLRNNNDYKTEFQNEINNVLAHSDPEQLDSETLSNMIRSVPIAAAEKVLPKTMKSQFPNEFSGGTIELINRKRKLWKFLQKSGRRVTRSLRDTYRSLCRETKRAITSDRIVTLEQEAAELSSAFKQDRFKGYSLLKRQHRSRVKAIMPPEKDFTEHYREHYKLGHETPLEVSSCELPPCEKDDTLSLDDFETALRSLNENRAAGHDEVAPEYLKRGGPTLLQWLFTLMVRVWTFRCELPPIDRIGNIVPIPKKTNALSVDSSRPICLLTSIYKLYAILVFQKVRDRVKGFVSWTQAGFIRGRSCANNLWILRRVAERSIEFKVPVYCALVDYKGAFDALNRTTLGRVLNLFLSPSMVKRVLSLYFDAKAKVTLNNSVGPEFDLQRGVRQGCPASPSFFTVALSFISWSFRLTYEGIKLVTLHLATLEYADDQILFTLSAEGMQNMLDFIINNAEPFGLRLSPKKCELICFHRPGTINRNNLPKVSVGDQILPWKQSVVYLGSRIAEDGNTLVAVKHRICCAETVIKRLDNRVFSRRNIDATLKGHFIDSAVFASLLYGLEHCAFGPRDQRCLDGFFLRLAKRVLHLPFDYHLSYVEAEQSLGVTRPSIRLRRERLRWTGHMLRSEDTVLYEALVFVPSGGARGRGRPRRRYYDTIKADLADRTVIVEHRGQEQFWAKLALRAGDRRAWDKTVVRGER